MSFVGGGGVGGAEETLAYMIKAYDMATPVFRAFGAGVEQVTKQVQATLAQMDRALVAQGKAVSTAATEQEAALNKVKKAQIGASAEAIAAADDQVKAARRATAATEQEALSAQRAADKQVASAARASAAFGTAESSVSRMGRNILLSTAAIGAGSIDMAAKFQANSLRMQTQAGATSRGLDQIRQGLLKMAGEVGATPDQLANGMYHVVSSMNAVLPPATRVSQELRIMKIAAEGAQIGHSHLEDTTYALSAAMNALHLQANSAGRVMGQLNAIVGSGDMTMQDLIQAFKSGLIPAAQTFGISLQSVGAALAVMGDMGMRGALAGTRLRMAISLLAAPTKQAAGILETLGMSSDKALASTQRMSDLLKKAGINVSVLSDDLRKPDGLQVALSDLNNHLKSNGLSADAAGAAIDRAFGGGRMGATIKLMAENTDRLKLKFDQIGVSGKQFGHDWQLTVGTFRLQVDKALASLEAFGIGLGMKLIPYATTALHDLSNMADWFTKNKLALDLLAGSVISFATIAVGSYLVGKLRNAISLMKDFGSGIAQAGRWMLGMSAPGAGPASGFGSFGAGATGGGGIWGVTGTQIRVGTMMNPMAVTLSGAGLATGASSATQAELQKAGGVGPAVTSAESAAMKEQSAAMSAQMAMMEENAAKQMSLMEATAMNMETGMAKAGEQLSLGAIATGPAAAAPAAVAADATPAVTSGLTMAGMKSAISDGFRLLLRGGAIAGIGALGSQLIGGAVGGRTGHAIADFGTAGSIGAGAGTVILGPGVGTAIGTAAGLAIEGLVKLGHTSTAGGIVADSLSPGFGGAALRRQVTQALDDAQKIKTSPQPAQLLAEARNLGLTRPGGTADITRFTGAIRPTAPSLPTPQLTTAQKDRMASDYRTAGLAIAKQLELGWNQYKTQSVPAMLQQFTNETRKLPAQAKATAAESAISFANTLVSEGKLSRRQADSFVAQIEAAFPALQKYMGKTAQDAATAFRLNINLDSAQRGIAASINKMRSDIPGLARTFDTTKGDIGQKSGAVIKFLQSVATDGTGPMAKLAKQDLATLQKEYADSFKADSNTVQSRMGEIITAVAGGNKDAVSSAKTLWKQFSDTITTEEHNGVISVTRGNQLMTHQFDLMAKNSGKSLKSIRAEVAVASSVIPQTLGAGSAAAEQALSSNFMIAAVNVQKLMKSGVISTKTGIDEINKLMTKALQALGAGVGKDVSSILNINTLFGPTPTVSKGGAGGGVGGSNFPLQGLFQGGKIHQPMYRVGEEAPAHPEYVLATNPAYRKRNQGLWAQAGRELDVPGFRTGGIGGPVASGAPSTSYVFPFPKSESFSWNRIDQGQDLQGPPGGPVLAIGPGNVSSRADAFGGFGPFYPILDLSAGPWAGRSVYYGHAKTTHTGAVGTGEIIGVTQTSADEWTAAPAGWLEFGFTTALGAGIHGQGAEVAPMLHALAAGHMVSGIGGPGGGPVWNNIKVPKWTGPGGEIGAMGQAVLRKITAAANAFGRAKAARMGGGASAGFGGVAGPVVTASWFDDPQTASGHAHVPGFAELSNPPGSLNFSALGHLPFGELIEVGFGGRHLTIPKVDVGAGGSGLGGHIRAIDLTKEAAVQFPGFIGAGLADVSWRDMHRRAFAQGGMFGAMGTRPPHQQGARSLIGGGFPLGDKTSQFMGLVHNTWDHLGGLGALPPGAHFPNVVLSATGQGGATGPEQLSWTSADRTIHFPYQFLTYALNPHDYRDSWARETIVHEMAHAMQSPAIWSGPGWEREGGAQAWADQFAPRAIAMPGGMPGDSNYGGFVQQVKKLGRQWIDYTQFGAAPPHSRPLKHAGAFGGGGMVTAHEPTTAVFGDRGAETAIFIPHNNMGGVMHGGRSTSSHSSTGAHSQSTTSTAVVGGQDITTTQRTSTSAKGVTTTSISVSSHPVSKAAIHTHPGLNPFTDRVETHTSADWAWIHANWAKQQHDAAAAKKKFDAFMAQTVTDTLRIGKLKAGDIQLSRKELGKLGLPEGHALSLTSNFSHVSDAGFKKIQSALGARLRVDSLSQAMGLAGGEMRGLERTHGAFGVQAEIDKKLGKLNQQADQASHDATKLFDKAMTEHGRQRQKTLHAFGEALKVSQDTKAEIKKLHGELNKVTANISTSRQAQIENQIITAAAKGIASAFSSQSSRFSASQDTLKLISGLPAGDKLGLSKLQLKSLGISRNELHGLEGGGPAAFGAQIHELTKKVIPAYQTDAKHLESLYRDALKTHNKKLQESLLKQLDAVTKATVQAYADLSQAQQDKVDAVVNKHKTDADKYQTQSDLATAIESLKPGSSTGLSAATMKRLGISPMAFAGGATYLTDVAKKRAFGAGDITAMKIEDAAISQPLQKEKDADLAAINQLTGMLPSLTDPAAKAKALNEIKALSGSVVSLTDQITKATDVTQQEIDAINAQVAAAQSTASGQQSAADITTSISNLAPGTNLGAMGLTPAVLASLGIDPATAAAIEGGGSAYISKLQNQQGGTLTPEQIATATAATNATNAQLSSEKSTDVGALATLEAEIPNLTGDALTTAQQQATDLIKSILGLTDTINSNNDAVAALTKATNANTTATGQMTGTVAYSYQGQDFTASLSSDADINLGLGG